jgi:hypothetical protein
VAIQKHIGGEHVRENDMTMPVEILGTDKTLFVAAMSEAAGENLDPIPCKTMSEVFQNFRPNVDISVEAEDGSIASSNLRFERVADFQPEAVIAQTPSLKALHQEMLVIKDLLNQLKSNKVLVRAVDSSDDRAAMLNGFKAAGAALGVKEV